MTKDDPRVSFSCPPDLYEEIRRKIPHGLRGPLCRKLLQWAIDISENHGLAAYGAILDGSLKPMVVDTKIGSASISSGE